MAARADLAALADRCDPWRRPFFSLTPSDKHHACVGKRLVITCLISTLDESGVDATSRLMLSLSSVLLKLNRDL